MLFKFSNLTGFQLMLIMATSILFSCSAENPTPPPVAPDASFTYSSTRLFPVNVKFTYLPSSPVTPVATFNWDFGDGGRSSQPDPLHAYSSAGTYFVKLMIVYADASKDTIIKAMQLIANGPGGVSTKPGGIAAADFSISIPSEYLVTFINSSTNASSFLWNFGDGNSSASAASTITHQYNSVGPFTATLKASNAAETDSCKATFNF